jgi:thioredoxin 1
MAAGLPLRTLNARTLRGWNVASRLVPLNDHTFGDWTANKAEVTVVCVGAKWCGNTEQLKPVLEDLSSQYAGTVRFAMVDFDESPEFLAKHNVTAVPTVLLFKDDYCDDVVDTACVLKLQERRSAIEEAIRRLV